jgi:hypothetical protein
LATLSLEKIAAVSQDKFAASADLPLPVPRRQYFIRTDNETLSVIAVSVRDPDY